MTTRRIPDEYLARLTVILRRVRRSDPNVEEAIVLVGALRRAPVVGRRSLPVLQPEHGCMQYRYRPDDEVRCKPFDTWMTVAECVRRQEAAEPSGAGKGHPEYERCHMCSQAEAHRAMIPDYQPPKFRRFNVARENKARAARQRLWKTGALERVPSMDEPPAGGEG